MITLPPALDSALVQSKTCHKATCYRIERTDGVIFTFTTANHDVVIDGDTYSVMDGGVEPTNRRKEVGLKGHSVETVGHISDTDITVEDIIAGRFRNATVVEYVIHPKAPWLGYNKISQYKLGEMTYTDEVWKADLKSLVSELLRKVGLTYQVNCQHLFGDTGCGISKATWTITPVTVASSVDRASFDAFDGDITSPLNGKTIDDDFFNDGEIVWLTGSNVGITSRVADYVHVDRVFSLYQSTPFSIQAGDTFTLIRGCNKILDDDGVGDCYNIYNNASKYNGFPWMPGVDQEFQTPPV